MQVNSKVCVSALLAGAICWASLPSHAGRASGKSFSIQTMAALASGVYDVVKNRRYTVRMSRRCWRTAARGPRCRRFYQEWQRTSPDGFATLFVFHAVGGVSAAVFEHQASGKVVLAFAGSNQVIDWIGANQNIARPRGQRLRAIQTVAAGALDITGKLTSLRKTDGSPIALQSVDVVGHSLGGYLTQLVTALQPVRRGVSFNGPGLYKTVERPQDELKILLGDLAEAYPRRYLARRMENHIKQRDPIGRFGKHFGAVYIYAGKAKNAHSMNAFLSELQHQTIKPKKLR